MGTNYYLQLNKCPTCGRYEEIHIGKSSAGNAFSLHVTDEIRSIDDWIELFYRGQIFNEYGDEISPEKMIFDITERGGPLRRRNDEFVVGHERAYSLIKGDFS